MIRQVWFSFSKILSWLMPIVILFLLVLYGHNLVAQQVADEIKMSIYFGGGSYQIDDAQAVKLVDWLDATPDLLEKYNIQLISHTDPIGGRQYNEWLSERRSQAVYEILRDHLIPEQKIFIKNWGLENPVYSNETFNGMQMNRRVDVLLYPILF